MDRKPPNESPMSEKKTAVKPLTRFRQFCETISGPVWFGICLVLLLICGWLAFAYVHSNGPLIGSQTRKDSLSWLPQLLTFVSLLIAAWQFNRKYNQDKEKYQQDKDQSQALREQSQLQFEIKALNDNYTDILNRFSNETSIAVRANAALRLAEIAQTPLPGKSTDKNAENFPFFLRASAQLAAALHIETEQPVRTEIVKAVEQMSQFIADGEKEIVRSFIHDFADANRTARKNFVHVFAECCAIRKDIDDRYLRRLVAFAPLCSDEELTVFCLKDFRESKEYEKLLKFTKHYGK